MAIRKNGPLLTKEQQVNEILKCGRDPVHFMKTYCRIQHPKLGAVPFETYPFQDECVKAFLENRLNIVLKSRQLGLSTLCAAYAAWYALFQKDRNILVIATKLGTAINFVKKVRFILQSLPSWLLLASIVPTKQVITFSNGSSITAIPTSEDAGRSEALSLLIVDEAAHIRDFDEIWTGLSPTISMGGRAIVLSTPKGVGGQYHKLWTEAEAGVNGFNAIRLPWNVHPEHDQTWFESETRNMQRRDIGQEYMCDFTTSGDTFLQPSDLEYVKCMIMQPVERAGDARNIWVWSYPVPGRTYVISADVARGDARDFSAFHIIDIEDCTVCAEYVGKIPPEKLADVLAEWGKKYNNALLVVEQNTYGYFVNTKLRDTGYPKVYYHDKKGDPFAYIAVSPDELPGFPTTQKTRPQLLTKLTEMIRGKQLKSFSQRLYDQFQTFVWNGAKAMATKDSFDDLVMSIAIGCWLAEGNGGINERDTAMAYAMLKATSRHRRDTDPRLAGVQATQPLVNPNIRGANPNNVYKPRSVDSLAPNDPLRRSKHLSDFSWLLK